jgi:type I restriction enzyme M protein
LAESDFNCNVRRYADKAPPPEPHDVRAHLHGRVPIAKLDDAVRCSHRADSPFDTFFTTRGDGYADWNDDVQDPLGP